MENTTPLQRTSSHPPPDTSPGGRKRSGSSASLLSKLPFLRSSENRSSLDDARSQHAASNPTSPELISDRPPRALAAALSQQKTRRRRGSLRKVALLGRGAAREKRESKSQSSQQQLPQQQQQQQSQQPQQQQQQQQLLPQPLAIDTSHILLQQASVPPPLQQQQRGIVVPDAAAGQAVIGLGLSDATPRPSMDGFASRDVRTLGYDVQIPSPTISYTSTTDTTDEEDGLSMSLPVPSLSASDRTPFPSASDPYYRGSSHRTQSPAHSVRRRRSTSKQKYAKSPLSLQGLATGSPALGNIDGGHHDYSETEWWGWVVLIVTWSVFVVGMGSCLNIWSWAWDVGLKPETAPELADDHTLPIVGYYPALMILTSIMAWVWVIVAWVGMKYFRHAKITGD